MERFSNRTIFLGYSELNFLPPEILPDKMISKKNCQPDVQQSRWLPLLFLFLYKGNRLS